MREWTTKHIEDLVRKTVKDMNIGSGSRKFKIHSYDVRTGDTNILEYADDRKYNFYISYVGKVVKINTLDVATFQNIDYYVLAAFPCYFRVEPYTTADSFSWGDRYVKNDGILQTNSLGSTVTIPKNDLSMRAVKLRNNTDIAISTGVLTGEATLTVSKQYDFLNLLLIKTTSAVVNENLYALTLKDI